MLSRVAAPACACLVHPALYPETSWGLARMEPPSRKPCEELRGRGDAMRLRGPAVALVCVRAPRVRACALVCQGVCASVRACISVSVCVRTSAHVPGMWCECAGVRAWRACVRACLCLCLCLCLFVFVRVFWGAGPSLACACARV